MNKDFELILFGIFVLLVLALIIGIPVWILSMVKVLI